jgi:hypothetical protein
MRAKIHSSTIVRPSAAALAAIVLGCGAGDTEPSLAVTSSSTVSVAGGAVLPPRNIALMLPKNPGFTVATAQARVNTDANSLRAYYYRSSHGKWDVRVDVFGPYDSVDATNRCESLTLRYDVVNELRAEVKKAGVNIDNYDNQITNMPPQANCPWGGNAQTGVVPARASGGYGQQSSKHAFVAATSGAEWGLSCGILSQEVGHNYGLSHEHTCSSGPYAKGCTGFDEYGGTNSAMGNDCPTNGVFNAAEQGMMDMLDSCNTLVLDSDGTYDIGPLHQKCTGPQVLRWSETSQPATLNYGYVEYHSGDGVYLHYGPDYKDPTIFQMFTSKMDATQTFQINSSSLKAGGKWTSAGGVALEVVSIGAMAKIKVGTGAGGTARCYAGESPPAQNTCADLPPPPTTQTDPKPDGKVKPVCASSGATCADYCQAWFANCEGTFAQWDSIQECNESCNSLFTPAWLCCAASEVKLTPTATHCPRAGFIDNTFCIQGGGGTGGAGGSDGGAGSGGGGSAGSGGAGTGGTAGSGGKGGTGTDGGGAGGAGGGSGTGGASGTGGTGTGGAGGSSGAGGVAGSGPAGAGGTGTGGTGGAGGTRTDAGVDAGNGGAGAGGTAGSGTAGTDAGLDAGSMGGGPGGTRGTGTSGRGGVAGGFGAIASDDSGCSCRVSSRNRAPAAPLAFALLGLTVLGSRRRQRAARGS